MTDDGLSKSPKFVPSSTYDDRAVKRVAGIALYAKLSRNEHPLYVRYPFELQLVEEGHAEK